MRLEVLCLRVALWNALHLWESFRLSIAICPAQFFYLQSILRKNRKTIISLTHLSLHLCFQFVANVLKRRRKPEKNDLQNKPIWQVFISDQWAKPLHKAGFYLLCLYRVTKMYWPFNLQRGYNVTSAVASMRPTEALASVKFCWISPIIFILHNRSAEPLRKDFVAKI